jgi:hypothetical protein
MKIQTHIDCDLKQMGDALAYLADEGRCSPRKSSGSWQQALIRRCPNEETPYPVRDRIQLF